MARTTDHAVYHTTRFFQMNLIFDQFIQHRPYPNLAKVMDIAQGHSDLWQTYPFAIPCRFLDYANNHDFPLQFYHTQDDLPPHSWYPVGIAFYNFAVDYFALLPSTVVQLIRNHKLRVLFYYHEGDDPARIQHDLAAKCSINKLPADCWRFISANTAARHLSQFQYFADHELLYWHSNRRHAALCVDTPERPFDFTLLIRTHKWWRATVAADLVDLGVLDRSQWSYGNVTIEDNWLDNPIEVDSWPGLRQKINDFIAHSPYRCDNLSATAHNQHHVLVPDHFQKSYIHIVCETFFDVDRSQGTFVTEKIFKPIKHGQPFVCIGPAHTLQHLRELGYRTFDSVLDNRYDAIENNTQRWNQLRTMLRALKSQNLRKVFDACKNDIIYNQIKFLSSKYNRLKSLQEDLNAS